MKIDVRKNSGFSITEMMVASVIVFFLSGMTYKVLSNQNRTQKDSIHGDKQNNQALTALDRFKADARMIDYNWSKYNVASVYPAQGLGLGGNFYVTTALQTSESNDGVTFLRSNSKKANINTLNADAEFPFPTSGSVLLYGGALPLEESTTQLTVGDWVILFKAEEYALGVVTAVSTTTPKTITIRAPNAIESRATHINVNLGVSSGFVTKSGIEPASFDLFSVNTDIGSQDFIKLEKGLTKIQAMAPPVSYELDWATNDGMSHGNGNAYLLDSSGNKKKVVVRTEYIGVAPYIKREYLAEADQMALTYDVLNSNTGNSLTGISNNGNVVKNVGRNPNSPIQFVNFSIAPNALAMSSMAFVSTSRILSINLAIKSDKKEGEQEHKKTNEIHVALDSSRVNNQFQKDGRVNAMNSVNMADQNNPVSNYAPSGSGLRIFSPAYLRKKDQSRDFMGSNQAYTPGSGNVDIVVPVGTVEPDMVAGNQQSGFLAVLDEAGQPATNSVSCTGSNCCTGAGCEKVTFGFGAAKKYFYPTTVVEKPAEGSATENKVYIGGLGIENIGTVASPNLVRKPMLATITYPKGMTFREFVKKRNSISPTFQPNAAQNHCSLGISAGSSSAPAGNCSLKEIAPLASAVSGNYIFGTQLNGSTSGSPASSDRLKDISSIAIDGDDIYMTSITRTAGNDSTMSIYKKSGIYVNEIIVPTPSSAAALNSKQVIGAIADPILIDGQKYLPVATSRSTDVATNNLIYPPYPNPSTGYTAEDGRILLQNLTTPSAPLVTLATHNFKANSLVNIDGGLLIGGKTLVQGVEGNTIAAVVSGGTPALKFYLDELASYTPATQSTPAVKKYADAYFTLPSAFANTSPQYSSSNPTGVSSNPGLYQNVLGWNTGISASKISEMEYGLVIGNQVVIDDLGSSREVQDFTTVSINFGGMSERVIATIKPYPNNLQASEVVVKYDKQKKTIPNVFLPGTLYANSDPRKTQFPLPNLPTTTSEAGWLTFYKDYNDMLGQSNDVTIIPDPVTAQFQCTNSVPQTCGMTGGQAGDSGASGAAGGQTIGTGTATTATQTSNNTTTSSN